MGAVQEEISVGLVRKREAKQRNLLFNTSCSETCLIVKWSHSHFFTLDILCTCTHAMPLKSVYWKTYLNVWIVSTKKWQATTK